MTNYLWIFLLGGIAAVNLLLFLGTFSKDVFLVKRLKKTKVGLAVNFSFLFYSLTSISLIIYLFILLKEQIRLIG